MANPNELKFLEMNLLGVKMVLAKKLPVSANLSPEKRCVREGGKAYCGCYHFSSVFGINAVKDHYNFVLVI